MEGDHLYYLSNFVCRIFQRVEEFLVNLDDGREVSEYLGILIY